MANKHGLGRDIPDAIKRAVRQRDGFGCVICGKAVIEYEHFDPEFSEATEHTVEGIVLLCVEHHGLKTRKLLSKETIAEAIQQPKAKQQGFSFGAFDIGSTGLEVVLGNVVIEDTPVILRIRDEDVLAVLPPEDNGGPMRLNASLRNTAGDQVLSIVNNEWRTPTENWDVQITANRISIRNGNADIAMVLRSDPPRRIVFERLAFRHGGIEINAQEGGITTMVTAANAVVRMGSASIRGAKIGILTNGESIMMNLGGGTLRSM